MVTDHQPVSCQEKASKSLVCRVISPGSLTIVSQDFFHPAFDAAGNSYKPTLNTTWLYVCLWIELLDEVPPLPYLQSAKGPHSIKT